MKNDSLKGQHRINEQIRAKEVRIVGDDVEPAVYPIAQALKMAEDHEADLVEISPNAVPPVCRIIDYSKFLYQLKKRQKEQKAKQVKVNVRGRRQRQMCIRDSMCSLKVVPFFSKNKAKYYCFVLRMTWKNMQK